MCTDKIVLVKCHSYFFMCWIYAYIMLHRCIQGNGKRNVTSTFPVLSVNLSQVRLEAHQQHPLWVSDFIKVLLMLQIVSTLAGLGRRPINSILPRTSFNNTLLILLIVLRLFMLCTVCVHNDITIVNRKNTTFC